MTSLDPAVCLLCRQPVSDEFVVNTGFFTLLMAMGPPAVTDSPAADTSTSSMSVKDMQNGVGYCFDCKQIMHDETLPAHCDHKVLPTEEAASLLRNRLQSYYSGQLASGSVAATNGAAHLQRSRQRMVDRCAASVAKLEEDAAALKAAIDAQVAKTKAAVNFELKARLKVIDGQIDGLSVSASQLSAGVALCGLLTDTTRETSLYHLARSCDSIADLCKLCVPYHGPAVSTLLEVVADPEALIQALTDSFVYLRPAADLEESITAPRAAYFTVKPADAAGPIADWVLEDIVTWCEPLPAQCQSDPSSRDVAVARAVLNKEEEMLEVRVSALDENTITQRTDVGVSVFGTSVTKSLCLAVSSVV